MIVHSTPSRWQTAGVQKLRVQKLLVHKHRWWRPLLWAALVTLLLVAAWQAATSGVLMAAEPATESAAEAAVESIALNEPWRFVDESKPGAPAVEGELAAAGEDAPTQIAARFTIDSSMQALALQLHRAELGGLPLSHLDELRYCTRLIDGPRPYAVTLQVNIDADVSDDDQSWQGRLVYTPLENGAVIQGEWQCWNTLVGKWWATGGPLADVAGAGNAQPLGTLLAHFPNLGINQAYSVVALKAGDGWHGFQGEASPLVIGVAGDHVEVAFSTVAPEQQLENEMLLPVLFNEQPGASSNEESSQANDEANQKKKDRWGAVDWGDLTWGDFDWSNIDWEKVDWEQLDWVAFGLYGARADAIRAFVEDVKLCRDQGWSELGYARAGDCVAHYVQLHAEQAQGQAQEFSPFGWYEFEWQSSWNDNNNDANNDDSGDERDNRNRRGRRGDD